MIQGLRTAVYPAPNLSQGRAWYREVLQIDPYFEESYYVGFSVGGFELGLVPDEVPGANGTRIYWGVENLEQELERLENLGAAVHDSIRDVGGGIRVASVFDPFGNVLGLIENPHFKTSDVR